MKITKLECIPITLPFKKIRNVHGQNTPGAQVLLLKIHTDEGIVGIGETGRARFGYTGDSVESVISYITRLGPRLLLGQDPFNIELIISRLETAAKWSKQPLAVVDCALYDIMGKKLGVPVYKLLGGLSNEKIPLGWVLGVGSFKTPEDAAETSTKVVAAGFHSIKLKVSRSSLKVDIEMIEAIRNAVGYDVSLAIDANGGWDYFQALHALKKLEKYDILFCEQPVPWLEIDNLARLRQKVGIPICADESATELTDLLEMIEKDAVDALFIKLAKTGGYLQSQKWVSIAEAAGLPVMCGCCVGSGLESAWQAHFLAASEWMGHMDQENLGALIIHDRFETVNPPITDDLVKNVPRVENGYMYPPDGPGLGVELNEELVTNFMTKGKEPTIIDINKPSAFWFGTGFDPEIA